MVRTSCCKAFAPLLLLLLASHVFAVTQQVLYSLGGLSHPDAARPSSGLVAGGSGVFYGVTGTGGTFAGGAVYQLTRRGSTWVETVIYSFSFGNPIGNLVRDADSNLYGVTSGGGAANAGVVFELSRTPSGWVATILYEFTGGADGSSPAGGITRDRFGNLYGVTSFSNGGTAGSTIFKLSPSSGGYLEETLFTLDTPRANPDLAIDWAGNLYGSTQFGGERGLGTVYRLSPAGGTWTYSVLHSFQGAARGDCAQPRAGVTIDPRGNVDGTTVTCGTGHPGGIFQLSQTKGVWQESILYKFSGPDGAHPRAPLIRDSAGNFYGTTFEGGVAGVNGNLHVGTVFQLSPSAAGYTFTPLHSFSGPDGDYPRTKLLRDKSGNLYGAASGGANKLGVVYQISP